MGFSVVRANDMAVKMAMMSDMGADGQDDCPNCLHLPEKAGAKATFCATVCAEPAIALVIIGPARLDQQIVARAEPVPDIR